MMFAIWVLGVIQTVVCAALCASFLLANRPNIPTFAFKLRSWFRTKILRHKESREEKLQRSQMRSSYLAVNLISWNGLYYPMLFMFSLLGMIVSPAFYSVHMLHIVHQNQLLSRAVQAVTLNGRSMLWVCFLGMIFFYIYAMIGFLFLRNVFSGNDLYCLSFWECFVTVLRNGLVLGMADNFEVPQSDPLASFTFYSIKAIYDISFFALITTIGLNMIFGIIIDTFSQLREGKYQIEEDMRSTCFICNRQSYEFEHHGVGFEKHVKEEHSMWAYLFFIIHLFDTPPNELSSLGLYVYNMVEQDRLDFFPIGRALSLAQTKLDSTDELLQRLVGQNEAILKHIKNEEETRKRQLAAQSNKNASQRPKGKFFFRKQAKKRRLGHDRYGPFVFQINDETL